MVRAWGQIFGHDAFGFTGGGWWDCQLVHAEKYWESERAMDPHGQGSPHRGPWPFFEAFGMFFFGFIQSVVVGSGSNAEVLLFHTICSIIAWTDVELVVLLLKLLRVCGPKM